MEVGQNGGWDGFVAVIGFIDVIGPKHGDPMLNDFVGLYKA